MENAPDLPLSLWRFCRQSLFREYGWQFFRHVALPHPLRTVRAMRAAAVLVVSGDRIQVSAAKSAPEFGGAGAIVGIGFCLKPTDPPCPSGRFNHDCACLEGPDPADVRNLPAPCRTCAIRELGLLTLRTGAAFYIMTSARDILFDVYFPALAQQTFATGLFVLCRYSLRPFAVGLLAAGIHGQMWPFATGDCRDYPTWLRADRGDKTERTEIAAPDRRTIREFLHATAPAMPPTARFEKRGQVLFPLPGPAAQETRRLD